VHKHGGGVAIEWPRFCRYWQEPRVTRLIAELGLARADFDGCFFGLATEHGVPIKKPWRVMTNDNLIWKALDEKKCLKPMVTKYINPVRGNTQLKLLYTPLA